MTLKQAKWNWNKECQKVFDTIKKLISITTMLSYPNVNKLEAKPITHNNTQ